MKLPIRLSVVIVVLITCFCTSRMANAQGVLLRSIGATNAAVGGTATAMPIDAAGALQWNPGSISAFKKNEMSFGLELIQAHSRVESSLPALYGGHSGSTKGEVGVVPAPSMAFIWSTSPRSPFTYGLGMSAIGGAASLYPHDADNPVLGGFSPLGEHGRSANVIVLQVTPTVSAQLTERLSVGVAPIVDLASLNINPMSLGRDHANPLMTYGTKYVWGGGFQIGALYDFKNHFKTGFMFKSPIWAEKLYFTGTDSEGIPDSNTFHLNLPMTLSAGISYDGIRNTIIGMDVRYFDYGNTKGFEKGVVAGKVEGLDWESIFSVNVGLERKINNRIKGRLGYCWNENPIPSRSTYANISAPMISQHVFSCGVGYTFTKDIEASVAYCHAFEVKSTGEIPLGIPGSSVTNTLSADSFFAGLTKKW